MWKQKISKLATIKAIRLLQLLLLFAALWFIFWAHIYEILIWNKTFLESAQSSPLNVLLYSISILAIILLEMHVRRQNRITTVSPSTKTLENLQKENEQVIRELIKSKQTPSGKIGAGFLIIGAVVLIASFVASSTVLAFIGLGLTLWGGLFLFARSTKFVRSTLLGFTAVSSYATIDRMIADLNYRGKAVYIPPYPKEAYLPEYLKGLKEMIIFIPAEDIAAIPTIEEMAKKQFLVKNPKGICVSPPGFGLMSLFEKELKADFTKIDLDRLRNDLSTVVVNLELAKSLEINSENDVTHTKIIDSVYKKLYSDEYGLKSIRFVGCPLTSAIACALAKTTGKLVTISKATISPDLQTLEAWYRTLEG